MSQPTNRCNRDEFNEDTPVLTTLAHAQHAFVLRAPSCTSRPVHAVQRIPFCARRPVHAVPCTPSRARHVPVKANAARSSATNRSVHPVPCIPSSARHVPHATPRPRSPAPCHVPARNPNVRRSASVTIRLETNEAHPNVGDGIAIIVPRGSHTPVQARVPTMVRLPFHSPHDIATLHTGPHAQPCASRLEGADQPRVERQRNDVLASHPTSEPHRRILWCNELNPGCHRKIDASVPRKPWLRRRIEPTSHLRR